MTPQSISASNVSYPSDRDIPRRLSGVRGEANQPRRLSGVRGEANQPRRLSGVRGEVFPGEVKRFLSVTIDDTRGSVTPPRLPEGSTSYRRREVSHNKGAVYGGKKPQEALLGYRERMEGTGDPDKKQGTVMGVVFPCMANILGVIVFLRGPWIVGLAGISGSLGVCAISCLCTFITSLSLAAVSTNGKIKGGGSYFLISRSLGPSIGSGVGLCFFFANAIGASMYFLGVIEAWMVAQPTLIFFDEDSKTKNFRLMGFFILLFAIVCVGVGLKILARLGTFFLMIVFGCLLCMYIGLLHGFAEGLSSATHINIPLANFDGECENNDEVCKIAARCKIIYDLEKCVDGGLKLNTIEVLRKNFTGFSLENIRNNWESAYDADHRFAFKPKTESFTRLLGIWFPACTGIMAGSNRSAELKNPSKSIPLGTLTAQITTTLIYMSMLLLFGASASRDYLLNDSFFASTSAWPMLWVVQYGVIFSSFGAGLQSLTSATRLLAAIAEDQTLPFLNFVKQDSRGFKTLTLASVICLCFIIIAELNTVAQVITMFFLICYFCVNGCCFLLGFLGDASWRPTFRFYHWSVALVGMGLCVVLMSFISMTQWWVALLALGLVGAIMFYSSLNSNDVNWGDGFRGVRHQLAQNLLMKASERGQQHTKNWRPQVLVLTGMTPDNDEEGLVIHDMNLIHFASQLKHGHGLCIIGGIVDAPDLGQGSFLSSMPAYHVRNWSSVVQQSLNDIGIDGFAEILYTSQRTEGIMTLIQTAGMGALMPNCVLVSWPFSWLINADARRRFIQTIQVCTIFQKTVIMAKEGHKFVLNSEVMRGTIDVWWVVADGGILLLLPLLLQRHKVWKNCKIRLYATTDQKNDDPDKIRTDLQHYCREHRIQNIEIHIVAMDGEILFNPKSFTDLTRRMRTRESLVVSGVLPHKLMQKDCGDHVFTIHRNTERVWHVRNACVDGDDPPDHEVHSDYGVEVNTSDEQKYLTRNVMSDPLPQMRLRRRMSARAPIPEFNSPSASGSSDYPHVLGNSIRRQNSALSYRREASDVSLRSEDFNISLKGIALSDSASQASDDSPQKKNEPPLSSFVLTEDRLESDKPCSPEILLSAKLLNQKMRQVSRQASLVVTNLPDVPEGESAFGYMQFVEHLCTDLPRVMLVRGTAFEVITAYT